MKKPGMRPSGSRHDFEALARQQGVQPSRSQEDLYRHSVRDDEDLDEWLRYLDASRRDAPVRRAPEP